jgi:hypothetical protein
MDRIERTELFGRHVICATACRAPRPDSHRRWEVRVSALELGSEPDAPLLRFPVEAQPDDPAAALEAAIRSARRQLMAATRKTAASPPMDGAK